MNPSSNQRFWMMRYLGLLIILVLWAIYCAIYLNFHQFTFKPLTQNAIVDLLGSLFVISLFLERAQEVFISAWRDFGKKQLQQVRERLAKAANSDEANKLAIAKVDDDLTEYTNNTRRASFLVGLGAGIVISLVGVRVLDPLIALGPEPNSNQLALFNVMDIFLTAGLIGGGSDGIHKVVSVILDFLDATRHRVNTLN